MSRYSSHDIRQALERRTIQITPKPTGADIQPASVELHLDGHIIANPVGDHPHKTSINKYTGGYMLMPGECLLASTKEHVSLPTNVVGEVWGKSSLGRQFIMVHCTAGYIDPGFRGKITLEIVNLSNRAFILNEGMKIAQIAFQDTKTPATVAYGDKTLGSHYQDQKGVQGALFD